MRAFVSMGSPHTRYSERFNPNLRLQPAPHAHRVSRRPSYVLRAIGLDGDDAEATVRFSLGFGTTDEDVEQAVALIEGVLAKLSKAGLARSA